MSHVFLLRAVNVGGTAKLPMADLRALATELGATDVQTYIASGNLIATPPGDPLAFARAREAEVDARFRFTREVIVRDASALRAARDAHPFAVVDPRFSYLIPLSAAPTEAARAAAAELPVGADEWQLIGDDLHVRHEQGAGSAELDVARLLRTLGVIGTARNLRTVDELLRLLGRTTAGV